MDPGKGTAYRKQPAQDMLPTETRLYNEWLSVAQGQGSKYLLAISRGLLPTATHDSLRGWPLETFSDFVSLVGDRP